MVLHRLLRAPLAHFLAGGALLFALAHGAGRDAAAPPRAEAALEPIVVSAADVTRLRVDYERETGLRATAHDEAALVEKAIDEELLYREALARGLDRHDRSIRTWLVNQMEVAEGSEDGDADALYARARALGLDRSDLVVRRILVQKMRLLAARRDEQPPTEDVLRAYYAQHRDAYRPPERMTFWQVFFATGRHAAPADVAAERLAALRADGTAPREAARLGDTFIAPPRAVAQSPERVATVFGPAVAAALAAGTPGTWIGPVASPYGAHLLWIETREPGAAPAYESVRGQLLERWLQEQRTARVADLLRALRTRYPLRVESAAWRERVDA